MGRTIEDIYDDIGGLGKAQWLIIALLQLPYLSGCWSMIQMVFIGMAPDWYCTQFDLRQSVDLDKFTISSVFVNESDSFEICSVNETVCNNFRYVGSAQTIVNEWNLVCQWAWVPRVAISAQFAGLLVGTLLSGYLSERYGRCKYLLMALLWHATLNLAAGASINWQMFLACRFLVGIGLAGMFSTIFPYILEFLPLKWRATVSLIPMWSVGIAIFVGAAYFLQHWRYLHFACAAFCFISLPIFFVVPESIRWLTVHGKIDVALTSLSKMAAWNGRVLPDTARETLQAIYQERLELKHEQNYTYIDLFKVPYTRRVTITLCIVWASMSLMYFGISFGASSLSGNVLVNILLMNLVEPIGYWPTIYSMDRFGRKKTTVSICISIVVISLASLAVHLTASADAIDTVVFWTSMLTKLLIDSLWNVVQTWTSELYPTVTRTLGFGCTITSARVGAIIAPFLIDYKSRLVLTYVTICSLSLVYAILALTLVETRLDALKDNMAHATPTSSDDSTSAELDVMAGSKLMDVKSADGEEGTFLDDRVEEETLNSVNIKV